MPFTFPARWWEKIPRAPNTNFSPGGPEAYARMGSSYPLYQTIGTWPTYASEGGDLNPGALSFGFDMDISISECPGDFNPQTACIYKGMAGVMGGGSSAPIYSPDLNSNSDLVMNQLGVSPEHTHNFGCALQGGKQYYVNTRVNKCFDSQTCIDRFDGRNGLTSLWDPGYWNNESRCREGGDPTWCRAWGHIQ